MLPFLAAAAISTAALLLGLVILREPATRQGTTAKTPIGFAAAFNAAGQNGIPVLITLYLLVTMSFTTLIAVFPLWVQAKIGWGPLQVGYAYAWIGLLIAGMQGGLIGPMSRKLGETGVFVIGAVSLCIGLYLATYVDSPLTFAVNAVLLCAGSSFCQPILTTLTSQRLGPEHQGAVLGLQGAAASFGRVASPPIAGIIFVRFGPDWPLLIASAIMLPVIVKAAQMALADRRQEKEKP
jgi:MFS family permease